MKKGVSESTFFDHSLKTIVPDAKESISEVEKDHDKFSIFRKDLKLLFTDISDSAVLLLYKKYSDTDQYLENATNAYLDNSGEFSSDKTKADAQVRLERIKLDHLQQTDATKPNTTSNYEYKSRKRRLDSSQNQETSKYFFDKSNNRLNKKAVTATNKTQSRTSLTKKKNVEEKVKLDIKEASINMIEDKVFWKKYIGTLNIPCWCTRSVYGLKSIYMENKLVFTKPQDSDVVYVSHQAENSSHRRELGRVAEELAEIIGPLMDEKAVVFESKLFFVDGERLSTGDTFVIRSDCFLSEHIFENSNVENEDKDLDIQQLKVMKDSTGKIKTGTRLKSSILKLFHRLDLKSVKETENEKKIAESSKPVTAGENDDRHSNDGLDGVKNVISGDPEFRSDEDSSDDAKLTMNQVKDLYKSTESNDLQQSLPLSIPDNFKIELRPYQQQGLSWMLQREKEYELVGLNNDKLDNEVRDYAINQLKMAENSVNPLWREYIWPNVPERLQSLELPPNCSDGFYLNLYKGTCSMVKPVIRSSCKGGILADEMGLGKTITTLSLVLSCPKDIHYERLPLDHIDRIEHYAYNTTLIVVPMALLTQWENEFLKVAKDQDKFRCFIYYGSDTLGNLKKLLCGSAPPTVVLTTYGMIQSEWSRMDKVESFNLARGLFSIKFLRVILDEGHNIRNKSTKTAKAVYALQSDRKWILTGTPIINRLEDLFSLVHYLGLRPWSYHSLWKQCISLPFETGKDVNIAIELLKSILDPILLRRTKNQKDKDGNYLVTLPPKEVFIEKLKFNKKEETIYNWLKEKAVNSFNENFKSGLVFKNYSSILTQLLRLRQVCCHVDLIKTDEPDSSEDVNAIKGNEMEETQQKLSTKVDDEMLSLVKTIEMNEMQQRIPLEEIKQLKKEIYEQYPSFNEVECSICTEAIDLNTCIITECKHCFCLSCLTEHFEFQLKREKLEQNMDEVSNSIPLKAEEVFCPMCRTQINKNRLLRTVEKSNVKVTNIASLDTRDDLLTQKQADGTEINREYFIRPFIPNEQSSKINALLIHLEQIKFEAPGEHVIVFSQFTSFLDIIEAELAKYSGDFKIQKFDGRLNLEQRQRVLAQFETPIPAGENKVSILLLSLKAGGVGLNLTVASRAFLMDPHWNNAIEFQAIDRIHRVGQRKNVEVVRFIMDNSIEERMLAIQARKNQLGEALTMNDEERRKRKLEDLQSLFEE